jgi:arylsulfatase A-like enzyme
MALNQPNILLVVVDCLRADHTLESQRSAQVPTLQSLARRGAAFSHMITVNSVTIPCMTSMLSGVYPVNHGVRGMKGRRISGHFPLLAEILHDAGYHTYAEVTSPLGPHLHLDRGFDEYHLRKGGSHPFVGTWGDDFIARFKNRELKEPWFMYLHLWEVHQPRHVLPQYNYPEYGATAYDRAVTGVDARLGELMDALDDQTLILVTADHGEKIPDSKLESRIENQKNLYKKLLARIFPARVARSIDGVATRAWYRCTRFLRRVGVLKTSLATLTGHGYHVYDIFVRVPFLIAGPGIFPVEGLVRDQVRQIDIFPTILDLAGLADRIPGRIDGRSLVPLLRGEALEPMPIFIETWVTDSELSLYYGVRTEEWKYAYRPHNPQRDEELFDLRIDPQETTNVADAHSDVIAQMRELAFQHFEVAQPDQQAGDELTEEELAVLTEHLQELGYIE